MRRLRAMLAISIGIIAASSLNAFAQSSDPKPIPSEVVEAFAQELLSSGRVGTTKREFTVFHYTHSPDAEKSPLNYIKGKVSQSQRLNLDLLNVAGNGLYLATNPSASASYGSIMLEIPIPKGSRVLRAFGDPVIQLSPKVAAMAAKAGCTDALVEVRLTLKYIGASCRPLLLEALKVLGVEYVDYAFNSTRVEGCISHSTAFVMLDSTKLDSKRVTVYPRDLDAANRDQLKKAWMFRSLDGPGAAFWAGSESNWRPALSGFKPTAEDLADFKIWSKSQILGCDDASVTAGSFDPDSVYDPVSKDLDPTAAKNLIALISTANRAAKMDLAAVCPGETVIEVNKASIIFASGQIADVTDTVARYCKGTAFCSYDIWYLSMSQPGKIGVTWSCSQADGLLPPKTHQKEVVSAGGHQSLALSCE